MEKFGYDFRDDDGKLVEVIYWTTGNRFFKKYRVSGVEQKTRRISESEYVSAYETYMNY